MNHIDNNQYYRNINIAMRQYVICLENELNSNSVGNKIAISHCITNVTK